MDKLSSPITGGLVDFVKNVIKRYLSTTTPGLFEILNIYCLNKYNKHTYQLLVESPCKLYRTLVELYRDEDSTDIVFRILIKPLIDSSETIDSMISYAKKCRDNEFIDTLIKIYAQNQPPRYS